MNSDNFIFEDNNKLGKDMIKRVGNELGVNEDCIDKITVTVRYKKDQKIKMTDIFIKRTLDIFASGNLDDLATDYINKVAKKKFKTYMSYYKNKKKDAYRQRA